MTQIKPVSPMQSAQRYRVKLRSHLDASWLAHLHVTRLAAGYDAARMPVTTLTVNVTDQADLIDLLAQLHGMGLSLLSVQLLASGRRRAANDIAEQSVPTPHAGISRDRDLGG